MSSEDSEGDHAGAVEDISSPEDRREEEQGLLGAWKEDAEDGERPLQERSRHRRLAVWWPVLTLVLLASLVIVGTLLNFNRKVSSGAFLGVQTNDYILDRTWDIDAAPRRREYTWTIRDHFHNPDGIYRPMMLVNNQFPGPLVEVNEGDTVVVHIENQAVNATSIHWHGIYQNGTNHMDGTVGVTQCPIPPGGKFTYQFTVAGQTGTYWWHGHYGTQSSDGLHGPFIVHGRSEKKSRDLRYATDRVILVSDHYHDLSSSLLWQYLKPDMENAEPVPNGALLNGRAIQDCHRFPHRMCDNSSSHVGVPTFELAPGQSHRLRFINVGAFAEFQLQIDEHELAVMEVDGTDVMPTKYHRLNISPAQRYSVVVEANTSGANQFWLRARMITHCFTSPPYDLQSEIRAVVRYRADPEGINEMPKSTDWEDILDLDCKDMNVTDLRPVEVIAAPAKADSFFYLRSNFEIGAYRLSRGFFNSSSWRPNVRSPTLMRVLDGIKAVDPKFASPAASDSGNGLSYVSDAAFDISKELVIQSTGIQTIDILISNFDDGNHPLHMHGYKYFVLAQGHGYPPLTHVGADITPENLVPLYQSLDLSNPLRRDTASVEAFGWIFLRLVADNPGVWAFHCHTSWHSEAGLLMQFLTRIDGFAKMQLPHAHRAMCAAEDLEHGMAPADAAYEDLAK